MAYGAAVVASGIALVSAVEAWGRLQHPESSDGSIVSLASSILLAVALPLLAVGAAIGLTWLARRLGAIRPPGDGPQRRRFDHADPITWIAAESGRAVDPPPADERPGSRQSSA
jgi:hypothetical protein